MSCRCVSTAFPTREIETGMVITVTLTAHLVMLSSCSVFGLLTGQLPATPVYWEDRALRAVQ